MGTGPGVRQKREHVQLLIDRLGSDLGKAVAQLADDAAYGKNRLAWHRKLFVEGMKESAFQSLPAEIVGEIEADSWASMVMCVARLTDSDDRRSATIHMLPRLIREDEELERAAGRDKCRIRRAAKQSWSNLVSRAGIDRAARGVAADCYGSSGFGIR